MSSKGGYKYIDFSGCVFTKDEESSTENSNVYKSSKAGIYDAVEATYGKCLRIGGLVLEDQEIDEQPVLRTIIGDNISFSVFIQSDALRNALKPSGAIVATTTISISADDEITLTNSGYGV